MIAPGRQSALGSSGGPDRVGDAGYRSAANCLPPVLLAAVLAAEGVSFLLVGSAALRLRGEVMPVGDTDAVIEPGEPNLHRLHRALLTLSVRPRQLPTVNRLRELSVASAITSYGKLDCLLERGRLDWDRLRCGAGIIDVTDVGVLVAAAADAWALRRQYRE